MRHSSPLAGQFRDHFGHRDHLYGVLLAEMADDLDAGGPTAAICRDHLDADRRDAIQLRLLAGLFRLVLRGDAPELAAYYPVLGGTASPAEAWPATQKVLAQHVEVLRHALRTAPQTNEIGRSAALAVGLFEVVHRSGLRRIRLLELGASAGLNLNVDQYRIVGPGWAWGPAHSPVRLDTATANVTPEHFQIVERRGCDLAPLNAATPDHAEYLTSFVWPFDLHRHARLSAALEIARRHPVTVERAHAAGWLERQLATSPDADILTVVWQSVTEQYWNSQEIDSVAAAVAEARTRFPIAHLRMEGIPPTLRGGYALETHGLELSADGVVVARCHHHGLPMLRIERSGGAKAAGPRG